MDPLYFLQFACFIFMLINALILYIIGPLALLSILFFNLSFVALGYNYVPTEELLDKEEEKAQPTQMKKQEMGALWKTPMCGMQNLPITKKTYSRFLRSVRQS